MAKETTFNKLMWIILIALIVAVGIYTNWIIAAVITLLSFAVYFKWLHQPQDIYKRQAIPEIVKDEVLRRQNGHCDLCVKNEFLEFHHRVPVAKGGTNYPDNIKALCPLHHAMVTRYKEENQ